MIAFLAIVLVFAIIGVYDGLPLFRQGHTREAAIFSIVWLVGLAYAIPMSLRISVPNPVDLLEYVFRPILPLS